MTMTPKNGLNEKVPEIRSGEPICPIKLSEQVASISTLLDSNSVTQADIAAQVIDLQMTVAHLELSLEQLDSVVAKQDKHIQTMQRQLQLMYKHIENQQPDDGIAPFDVLADKPPHY
ncbi:SlyX family protein [Psychrobacter aestuarii]|uniref:SlyX family protein n=1 Tax=Psychrobacter aestuarii TaxID=556327 RepID=A0ABN0VNX4_9GAMM|nr:SlyX family protein [Psychrobacter aestuarii]